MKYLAPEVVQTSALDCGPAALKCLLEGFGKHVSYGRLREACQTGVDGTSIDSLETVANQLGLEAEQIMIPADHLLTAASKSLPAIVVVKLPSGLTHFVVAWRTQRGSIQVMDPATGRRWPSHARFLSELYIHATPVPASAWREFASSDEYSQTLRARITDLGVSATGARSLQREAEQDSSWRGLAALDAAVRLTAQLVRARAVKSGKSAGDLVAKFLQNPELIPANNWSVGAHDSEPLEEEQVLMRGAVLVRVRGLKAVAPAEELGPELAATLSEKPVNPGRELLRLLRESGWLSAALLFPALALAAGGTLTEAVLFRGLFDLSRELALSGQRMAAIAAVACFSSALLLLEAGAFSAALRIGRQIENRLRIAFLHKIPRLGDRYFQSRLISDMAQRSHTIERLHTFPELARQLLRLICEMSATLFGIAWLLPDAWPILLLILISGLAPAFGSQPALAERDLRVRTHAAALTRFYLDALLGLVAVRAHGAARSLRRQHETLLGDWAGASFSFQRQALLVQAIQLFSTTALVIWLLGVHFPHGAEIGRILLVAYWALNLPALSQDIGVLVRQYPYYRNLTLRFLEPLGAREESLPERTPAGGQQAAPNIQFRSVSVEAAGHTILSNIDLDLERNCHVAIVGPSGAGKSSLAGILLGLLKPREGEVLIDGSPLDAATLRQQTAWVDPSIQIWNRSLLSNLTYGAASGAAAASHVVDAALLRNVLENLPEGLQTVLGEGGGQLSGGEGQRVRFGRALARENARLAILDEPFRGLDREKRSELLRRARHAWADCTLICITHDIEETSTFDRVLVVENGAITANGAPADLFANPNSRYRQLIEAETRARHELWNSRVWRRIRVHSGRVIEDGELAVSDDEPSHSMELLV